MDYDQILVMSDGKAVEFGPPEKLLQNEDGVFTELVRNTGRESEKALKKMASSSNLTSL
jgi:ABC-type multidrug transport system fused ATPase/permease subunit